MTHRCDENGVKYLKQWFCTHSTAYKCTFHCFTFIDVIVITMVLARSARGFFILSFFFWRNRHHNGPCTLRTWVLHSFKFFWRIRHDDDFACSVRALFFVLHFLRSRHDNGPCTLCACVIHHFTPYWRNRPATGRYKRDDKFSFFFSVISKRQLLLKISSDVKIPNLRVCGRRWQPTRSLQFSTFYFGIVAWIFAS